MNEGINKAAAAALAITAVEWFKASRRLVALAGATEPARGGRERAQLAFSRSKVEDALSAVGMRLVDHDGEAFSPELPAEPVNPEDFGSEEALTVSSTIEPTVMLSGRILSRGRVVLAKAGN